jgi:hypothetical protein
MNEKCNDRYTFQTNRIPSWILDLIFKYLPKHNGPYHDTVIKVALTRVVIKVNIKRYRFMQL